MEPPFVAEALGSSTCVVLPRFLQGGLRAAVLEEAVLVWTQDQCCALSLPSAFECYRGDPALSSVLLEWQHDRVCAFVLGRQRTLTDGDLSASSKQEYTRILYFESIPQPHPTSCSDLDAATQLSCTDVEGVILSASNYRHRLSLLRRRSSDSTVELLLCQPDRSVNESLDDSFTTEPSLTTTIRTLSVYAQPASPPPTVLRRVMSAFKPKVRLQNRPDSPSQVHFSADLSVALVHFRHSPSPAFCLGVWVFLLDSAASPSHIQLT